MMILALSLAVSGVFAQKIDQRLTRLVEQSVTRRAQVQNPIDQKSVKQRLSVSFKADGTLNTISAFATLKEGVACPTAQLEQMGIEVRYIIGDMVALRIPADRLLQLEKISEFSYVKADEMACPMNEEARKASGVEKVNTLEKATALQLPKAYTGAGVVLGVIDIGFDYNHAAFRHPTDGKTRIVKAVKYLDNGTRQVATTDADIKAMTTDFPGSHGTHTSATAGGSPTGNGQQGMAPEAELILCGLGNSHSASNIIECIKDIFDYATSVGKPAVVSISMGITMGLHDGSNETTKGIVTLTENGTKPGRVVVMSTGNAAMNNQSIVKKFNNINEEMKTVLGANSYPSDADPTCPVTYNTHYCAYADDYGDFTCRLKLVNITNGQILELGQHVRNKATGNPVTNIDLEKNNIYSYKTIDGKTAYVYEWGLENYVMDSEVYRIVLQVYPGKAGQTIKLMCDGGGNLEPCFDAPNWGGYNFANAGYTKGNGDFSFSKEICNESIISVGAYTTRTAWTDYNGKSQNIPVSSQTGKVQAIGEIGDFSSYGVADNGVCCPTVIAPGKLIMSAVSNYDTERLFVDGQPGVPDTKKNPNSLCSYVEKFGRKNWYSVEEGTSMSTPVAAGIVTLWMQANPQLTAKDIRQIMKETCVNDEWTTNVEKIPSRNLVQAGYGKIDCVAGLKKITGATAIDIVGADGHREATPSTMYSVDAPVYNMKGQQVDKSYKGLVIYKGRKYVNR